MQVKFFQVRLSDEHLNNDQENLNNFMEKVIIKKSSTQFVNSEPVYWSVVLYYEEDLQLNKADRKEIPVLEAKGNAETTIPKRKNLAEEKLSASIDTLLTETEQKRLEALKQWRNGKANELKVPGYMVSANADLLNLVKINPGTVDELTKIKGFGPVKIKKYGEDIIALLNSVD